MRTNLIVSALLLFAFILRVAAIGLNPPSLNWDEVSHGYNAYSILRTGKDEWGEAMPLIFRAFGDYKLPVYIYLTSISEFLFGISAFSVRLPSALAGVGIVFFTYKLAKLLTKREGISVLAAALAAIEPWGLFLSRVALEANLAQFFVVSGLYFLLCGLKNQRTRHWATGIILLGVSVWTYNSARIFVPLIIVYIFIVYFHKVKVVLQNQQERIYLAIVFLIFFLPMVLQLFGQQGMARYGWVGILDEGAIGSINELRNASSQPPLLARVFFNKATYFVWHFSRNWLSHYSPGFIFLHGGDNYQFNVPDFGLIYPVELASVVAGILFSYKYIGRRKLAVLIGWIMLAPVASGLTREAPHTLRSITFLPIPMVLSAIGIVSIYEWIKKHSKHAGVVFGLLTSVLIFYYFESYMLSYFTKYRENYSWSWQYGYKEAVLFMKENYDGYEKIVVSKKYGEPHEFILFYWPWEPQGYLTDENLIRFEQSNWYWVDAFDKFYFVNDWDIPETGMKFSLESGGEVDCSDASCLLVTDGENAPNGWRAIGSVNFLNGERAFGYYENK